MSLALMRLEGMPASMSPGSSSPASLSVTQLTFSYMKYNHRQLQMIALPAPISSLLARVAHFWEAVVRLHTLERIACIRVL